MSSASFDLRTDELDSFIFLHEMLFRHIDFGVIYILDHPFCSASGVPGPGDHRYVYYLRTQSTSGVHTLPRIHFTRLPTTQDERANARLLKVTRVSTGMRYDILDVIT